MKSPIIDAHIHLFPEDIPENWQAYADRDPWFARLTRKPENGKGTEEAWATADECLACADAAGVEKMFLQGWYWNDVELMRLHNDYMASLIAKYPDRFVGFAAVNPLFGDQALYEVERCKGLGFFGIGELGPGGNGYDFTSPDLYEVLAAAQNLQMPVCIHCGEPVGHEYPGKDRTPLFPILQIVRKFPQLKLILAHQGGGLLFYELYPQIQHLLKDSVYYDLAANPLLYAPESIGRAAEIVGSHRLLFGSDFPLLLYPRKKREMDMQLFIDEIKTHSGLRFNDLNNIMYASAVRLLKSRNPH